MDGVRPIPRRPEPVKCWDAKSGCEVPIRCPAGGTFRELKPLAARDFPGQFK